MGTSQGLDLQVPMESYSAVNSEKGESERYSARVGKS